MRNVEIQERTFQFSKTVIEWTRVLPRNMEADVIRKQILRSATSICANVTEARHALTRKEYIQYLQIALRSSRESEYWLRLCGSIGHTTKLAKFDVHDECSQISKILATILVRSKGI